LTDVKVQFDFHTAAAAGSAEPISRTYPRQLTDLFSGEQFVWVGRYKKFGSVKVSLSGVQSGARQTFNLTADLVERSVGESNGFVEKVWATRRIGELIDDIDLHGQNRELIDELVQLSMKHGILTPYTSFLADERVDLANSADVQLRAGHSLRRLEEREGKSGFDQRVAKNRFNLARQAPSLGLNAPEADALSPAVPASPRIGGRMPAKNGGGGGMGMASGTSLAQTSPAQPQPSEATVLNVGQKTFYRRNNRWEDAEATGQKDKDVIHLKQYSKEFFELAARDNSRFAKYLAIDAPALVHIEGQTYSIESASE
jgi:Ca-activated chloride channel family protein